METLAAEATCNDRAAAVAKLLRGGGHRDTLLLERLEHSIDLLG